MTGGRLAAVMALARGVMPGQRPNRRSRDEDEIERGGRHRRVLSRAHRREGQPNERQASLSDDEIRSGTTLKVNAIMIADFRCVWLNRVRTLCY
jgi:hypothetical protein